MFRNGLVVDDPVGLITSKRFWIRKTVTSGFSLISARVSGCDQPLETGDSGRCGGRSAECIVHEHYFGHTIQLTLSHA